MSSLSTHVLDTMQGVPAAGVALVLHDALTDAELARGETDGDGRYRAFPELAAGQYRLTFAVGAYFRAHGVTLAEPAFLDEVPVVFGLGDAGHVHVPLLVSPYAYSTYRGS